MMFGGCKRVASRLREICSPCEPQKAKAAAGNHRRTTPSVLAHFSPMTHGPYASSGVCQSEHVPQNAGEEQKDVLCHRGQSQLPAIYNGIGLGVYQGEAVVFLQMAYGERRWIVYKPPFDHLRWLPQSLVNDLSYLSCLLHLASTQPDLVKQRLQTQDGIALMRGSCPYAQSHNASGTSAEVQDGLLVGDRLDTPIPQNRPHQECQAWQECCPCGWESITRQGTEQDK